MTSIFSKVFANTAIIKAIRYKSIVLTLLTLIVGLLPASVFADAGLTAITVQDTAAGKQYSVTLQILALMTVMSLLPAILLTMTSFTRIIIVLSILRQALGTAQTPSNQVLIGLSLFLTFFIMSPVFTKVYNEAYSPYVAEKISADAAIEKLKQPFHDFMMAQTREDDIALFARIADHGTIDSPESVPFSLLLPAFLTSELKTAFQIGFMLFIPFLIIDLVVASVLMAMGMMMLSPLIISLPFKLMLFVLIDGWALITGTLAMSFVT
ncbi:MAG: flagellar type III secretion system pore protein FliP [Gammaproteobacteria bacterium]|nr:flagellar type III secretion system pore protein FliP [Gammaproteobacteria bacterium]